MVKIPKDSLKGTPWAPDSGSQYCIFCTCSPDNSFNRGINLFWLDKNNENISLRILSNTSYLCIRETGAKGFVFFIYFLAIKICTYNSHIILLIHITH